MEQRQLAVLGAGVVILIVVGGFAASVLFGSPGSVTRELPEKVSPGDTLIVRLQFNLSEPQTVMVHETITGAVEAEETRTVQNVTDQMIFYDVPVPEDASGTLTFSGTLPDLGVTVGGASTVEVRP